MTGTQLERFRLYVDGKDIETGSSEFFPYAEKAITELDGVQSRIQLLKRGTTPADVFTYFYARYFTAGSELNRAAIEAAHRAYRSFRRFSLQRRIAIFDTMRELLEAQRDKVLQLLEVEGHPPRLAEWEYSLLLATITPASIEHFAQDIERIIGRHGTETVMEVRRPQGVVCVSTPRNTSAVGFMTVSALLAGNTMVIKPPHGMPLGSIYIWRNIVGKALEQHGAPAGCVNVVVGESVRFVQDWMDHPHVSSICFFGQSDNGLELGKAIYAKGKRPILELSGNDCLLVWKDAPLDRAAESLCDAFMASMQACMVPKRALVHEEVYEEFSRILIGKVARLKPGLPSNAATILTPVSRAALFTECLRDAQNRDAQLLIGGYRMDYRGNRDDAGIFVAPTVIGAPLEVAISMKCVQEEGFFPLLPLIKVSGDDGSGDSRDSTIFTKMMDFMEASDFGLRTSVWVMDPQVIQRFVAEAHHSGMLRINSRHLDFSQGLSVNGGIGRSGGPFGEMNHVWQKTSHLQGVSIATLGSTDSSLKVDQ